MSARGPSTPGTERAAAAQGVSLNAWVSQAVQGALASKYRNTGQTCVCANRLLVQNEIYDEFAARLLRAVSALKVGDGLKGPTDLGPLIDAAALAKVQEHVADARAKGAKITVGGKPHALGGTFYEPTIVTEATSAMRFAKEETFGPVAPLFRFRDEAEALHMANDTEFGLACYLYTRDLARAWRCTEALEYGIVGLNTGLISTEVAPFGGVKQSGFGREGSHHGILDYTELKYLCIGGITPL
jgi:succinate-semialdehyde dehydrogenase/glutarate-semialdehyde dehydrogenase